MNRIFSVLVENRSGVLNKVAGLFARRCFNIDSLAVGETDEKDVSVMTIVSSGTPQLLEQIEKQLNKKLDVIKVKTFEENQAITRELMLIKVKYNKNNRRDIMETCEIMNAQIVDMSKTQMMIQICDTPDKIKLMISMLNEVITKRIRLVDVKSIPGDIVENLPNCIKHNSLVSRINNSTVNGIDLEDYGDTYLRRFAYNVIWVFAN